MKPTTRNHFQNAVSGIVALIPLALLLPPVLCGCAAPEKSADDFAKTLDTTVEAMKKAGFSGRVTGSLDLDQIGEIAHVLRGPGRARISATAEINSAERHMLDLMIKSLVSGLEAANERTDRLLTIMEAYLAEIDGIVEKTAFLAEKPTFEAENAEKSSKSPFLIEIGPPAAPGLLLSPFDGPDSPIGPLEDQKSPEEGIPELGEGLRDESGRVNHE